MKTEKSNSVSQKPSFFYARHMQPGTCRYDEEMVLVDTDAVQAMIKFGSGIPVFIQHKPNYSLENMKGEAAGYVTESFYNELDGWAWFKFMAIDDEVRIAVSNGWSVSNAYNPVQVGASGTKNNVSYDREILEGEFTHLAIVPNPRYENACIMSPEEFKAYQERAKAKLSELQNSKKDSSSSKGNKMLKLFKTERKEISGVDLDSELELENGKVVTIQEMMNACSKENSEDGDGADKKKSEEEKMNEEVTVDGEKMTVRELANRYMKKGEKRNAEEEEAKKKEEEKAAVEKRNAEEEDKKKEKEKENGKKNFKELKNAKEKSSSDAVNIIETSASKVRRGMERYGQTK